MKNVLVFLLIIINSFSLSSQIGFKPKAEIGYYFEGVEYALEIMHSPYIDRVRLGNIKTRIGADMTYKGFGAGFDQSLYMSSENLIPSGFSPTAAKWDFYLFHKMTNQIKIKLQHTCIHPVTSYREIGFYFSRVYGGYTSIMISYGY